MVYVCKCNNCENLFEDMNPDSNLMLDVNLPPLVRIKQEGDEFWGCPICKSDDYLSDLQFKINSNE